MPSDRPVLNANLDPQTRTNLRRFCRDNAVTASGLIEAFARTVAADRPPKWVRDLVALAQLIDDERRGRS